MMKRVLAPSKYLAAPPEASKRLVDYIGNRVVCDDAMRVETWRLPEALACIRAAKKGFSRSDGDAFVAEARILGGRAFALDGPRSGDTSVEGRLLLDMAAVGRIQLYSHGGLIEKSLLGPDASILPRGDSFAIWPRIHAAYDECIVNVWCKRQEVQSIWRYFDSSSARDELECQHWLERLMRDTPQPMTKKLCRAQVQTRFPDVSARGFNRAWERAIEATGADAWRRAGRRPPPEGTT